MQAAKSPHLGECEKIIIRRGNGTIVFLGNPKTLGFKVRLMAYKLKLLWEKYRG